MTAIIVCIGALIGFVAWRRTRARMAWAYALAHAERPCGRRRPPRR